VLANPGEKLYLSLAHSDEDIERILDAAESSSRALATMPFRRSQRARA